MNYKKEINKLKKHRDNYFPVISRLIKMHENSDAYDFPFEITDIDEIVIILELIELAYLDEDSFIIKKNFTDITNLLFTGDFPLTDTGCFVYNKNNRKNMKNHYLLRILFILLIVLLIYYLIYITN